jgi:hypothetical protein
VDEALGWRDIRIARREREPENGLPPSSRQQLPDVVRTWYVAGRCTLDLERGYQIDGDD